jgi:hypothetical protein
LDLQPVFAARFALSSGDTLGRDGIGPGETTDPTTGTAPAMNASTASRTNQAP